MAHQNGSVGSRLGHRIGHSLTSSSHDVAVRMGSNMTIGQKVALLAFVMLVAFAGIISRHLLFGSFNMGDRTGTIGLMAIMLALILGTATAAIFPEAF